MDDPIKKYDPLHPTMRGILAAHLNETGPEPTPTDGYIVLLRRHDWEYEAANGDTYSRGRDERIKLDALQRSLDPDYTIWNQYCPEHFRRQKP